MPTPTYKGDTAWKQQRGTTFGSSKEGLDHIELKYRGPSGTVAAFLKNWPRNEECPEPGFSHCKLIHSPSVKEDSHGYSTATLRFEGVEQDPSEGQLGEREISQTTYSFSANWLSFRIDKFPNNEKEMPSWYSYLGESMTARYTSKTRPTANNLIGGTYAATHLTKPEPKRKDSGEGPKAWLLDEDVDYVADEIVGSFTYEETGDFFDVTEVWETFLESNN
tara:strand:- start:98 stop:760 length:663 start_codon:yes stop_codon:yes gene_type:complete